MNETKITKFSAEYLPVMAEQFIPTDRIPPSTRIKTFLDREQQMLCIQLHAYLLAMPKETLSFHVKYPEDWWQAVKERFFPKWLLARFPVKYVEINREQKIYHAVCQHSHREPEGQHLAWLAKEAHKP